MVASVGITAGVDIETVQGRAVLEDLLSDVRQIFVRENVKVYLMATQGQFTKSALLAANLTGMLGSGNAVLLTGGVSISASVFSSDPVFVELQHKLDGAIGLLPYVCYPHTSPPTPPTPAGTRTRTLCQTPEYMSRTY
jgi:hypothetical protein